MILPSERKSYEKKSNYHLQEFKRLTRSLTFYENSGSVYRLHYSLWPMDIVYSLPNVQDRGISKQIAIGTEKKNNYNFFITKYIFQ